MLAHFATAEKIRWRGWVLLLFACLAMFAPGQFALPPIDRDEARFAQATRQMVASGDYVDIRFQEQARHKKPVGIHWLQAASVQLLADDPMTAPVGLYRLPSLVGAVLAVLLTAALGALLFGGPAGLLAGLLLAATLIVNVEARFAKADAALLACVVAAMLALAQSWRGQRHWGIPLVLGIALGIGGLIKGPIILIPVLGTVLLLSWWEKNVRWQAGVRWWLAIPVCLVILLPWLVAIGIKTDGAFFAAAVGQDLLGKVASGQNWGGAPPGLHTLATVAIFWPGSLLLLLALPWLWVNRREPALRFCLAWALPVYVVFELVLSKLVHYTMPAYPALAILCAAALLQGGTALLERRRWVMAAMLVWMLVTLGLMAAIFILPLLVGAKIGLWHALAALFLMASSSVTLAALAAGQVTRAGWLVPVNGLALLPLLFAQVLPGLTPVWLSPQVATAMHSHRPCADSRLVTAGMNEPSLVFLAGTDTGLLDRGERVAAAMRDDRCVMGLVDGRQLAAFEAAGAGLALRRVATIDGFNYGDGDWLQMGLYVRD